MNELLLAKERYESMVAIQRTITPGGPMTPEALQGRIEALVGLAAALQCAKRQQSPVPYEQFDDVAASAIVAMDDAIERWGARKLNGGCR
jgi:hypothetical protein